MANRGNFKLGKNEQMLKEESALGSLAKANSNALTTMNKIISLPELQLPKNWEKLHLDLDAACDIYEQLKRNGVKEHFTQVDSFKIYAILCVINYSLSKIHQNDLTSLYVYKLPLKELAQIVNCGKCGVSQTKEVKKQLVLITKLVRYEGKQIIFIRRIKDLLLISMSIQNFLNMAKSSLTVKACFIKTFIYMLFISIQIK